MDKHVKTYMQGDSSQTNKKNFFSKRCKQTIEDMIINNIENSAEFYKKINSNDSINDFVFEIMYKNYQKQLLKKQTYK